MTMRHFEKQDLDAALAAGLLTTDQHGRLISFLETRGTASRAARFDFSHLLWYAGALVMIGAMGLFTTLAFEQMGGKALIVTAIVYAVLALILAHLLWHRPGLRTPAGLLVAVAVSMTPLAIYGFQTLSGLWPEPFGDPGGYGDFYDYIKASWVFMDVGTIVAGAIALRFYPFPFIAAIIAAALWFLSMDLTPWIYGPENWHWEARDIVSMWFGLAVMAVAWGLDLKRWPAGDFPFWLHLCGVVAFWGGMTLQDSDSELSKALYCLINIALLCLAIFLMRRVYAIFGALGVAFYLGHLADHVFLDSLLFPLVLSLIGLAIIGGGILYFRRRQAIIRWLADSLPAGAQKLRPAHARAMP